MTELDSTVPEIRVQTGNLAPVRESGDYVLYWMIANRRAGWNFSLDRAVDWARALGKPLLVLEALRCDHPWASDRLHAFVIQGMVANARRFDRARAAYYPYLENRPGEGKGLLEALARRAAVVVTDDFPCFFLPRMGEAAAARLPVRLENVDSNGLLPLRAADRVFSRAVDFRRLTEREGWNPSRLFHKATAKKSGWWGMSEAAEAFVDGRDPNSYSGIFWCLGRYDRAWGPERPIFGKVRYMSSESTRRKLDAKAYLRKFGNRMDQDVLSR